MSSNKRIKSDLKSETKLIESRQTFSDRICDDLCEVLLSYLSFEDKIRFECVSQQFKRTVYQKQYELVLSNENPSKFFETSNKFLIINENDLKIIVMIIISIF